MATTDDQRVGRDRAYLLVLIVLVVVLGGYVYLGYQGWGLSAQLDGFRSWHDRAMSEAKKEIIAEVTVERERRLSEVQTEVKTEQKRQDALAADVAAKADERATAAETKAEVAKKKATNVEKRTSVVEKHQRIVDRVLEPVLQNPEVVRELLPIVVPTPAMSIEPEAGGLIPFLLRYQGAR